MFLERLQQNNPKLIDASLQLFKQGAILPDTYVLDYDMIMENGRIMKQEADKYGIHLYYMLKQIGRNPLIAKGLDELGFDGCVAVDYKEALVMKQAKTKIAHLGHLIQIPTYALESLLETKPHIITVYSYEKIEQINAVCQKLGFVQNIMLRITDDDSALYSGQIGGFNSNILEELVKKIEKLSNVKVAGLTVFPALLFNKDKIAPTDNMKAMNRAIEKMKKLGYENLEINVPSCSCYDSMKLIASIGGTSAEPGHGLTGTTPLHKISEQPEKVGYIYVSEVSHNFKDKAYCYGGGHYRRGHLDKALVGYEKQMDHVVAPDDDSIDYHFELQHNHEIGQPVLMCFRTQLFTTRSNVAVVKGIQSGKPELMCLYNSLGEKITNNWSK